MLRAEPGLNPTELQGAWQFYDGQVSLVERLVIENALDAASEGAADRSPTPRPMRFLRTRQARSPARSCAMRSAVARSRSRARLTVNATGPWLDLTTAGLRTGVGRCCG